MKKLSNLLVVFGLSIVVYTLSSWMIETYTFNKGLLDTEAAISQQLKSTYQDLSLLYDRQDEWLSEEVNESLIDKDAAIQLALDRGYKQFVEAYESPLPISDVEEGDDQKDPHEFVYLGTILIPSIDLDMPLVDGVTENDLRWSAGHMKQTAYPGQIGNAVIAGHRGYNFGRLFNRLNELKKNDIITIKTPQGLFSYKVYETKIVDPSDTSVVNQTDKHKVLTLITCDPIYKSTHRLIIHAVMQ